MKFKLLLEKAEEELILTYDNMTSELRYENGDIVIPQNEFVNWEPFYKMDAGKRNLVKIKIQLGLKCNYSCTYCSQRFVPRNPGDNPQTYEAVDLDAINTFIKRFDTISIGETIHFEMWGGEPFMYFGSMKHITEQLHKKFPHATFSVITNGSLLTDEIVEFLFKHGFSVSLSHDAVGQETRGRDPLDNADSKRLLFKLRNALVPQGKFSVNTMIHKDNDSRADVQKWIKNVFGVVPIGEAGTVDAYDEGGTAMSWQTPEEHIAYRRKAFNEIMNGKLKPVQMDIVPRKIDGFISTLKQQTPASSLMQKCTMDRPDVMAVDLSGNVTTCQNVTASSQNMAGISHKIGHMDDLESVNIATGTHWSDREECPKCPVLHLCQGACLFLPSGSQEWKLSCDNSYSDNVVWLAASLYELTGHILYRIENDELPEYRKDIFGFNTTKYAVEDENSAKILAGKA